MRTGISAIKAALLLLLALTMFPVADSFSQGLATEPNAIMDSRENRDYLILPQVEEQPADQRSTRTPLAESDAQPLTQEKDGHRDSDGYRAPVETQAGLNGKHLSRIEQILSGDFPKDISRRLQQFGYDFFNSNISTFAPVSNVPVGDSYIIGPGDEFSIHLWGNVEEIQKTRVSRDGKIMLPRLGTVTVNGMTFAEMKHFLTDKYRQFFPDLNLSISMDALRSLEVFIIGEVNNPGTYTVSSLSTIITALYASGGPSKNGSLRNIKLFRNGQQVKSLDLYDFLIRGLKNDDVRLQPADTIFVPVLGPVVGIAGNIRRPAIYEVKDNPTIEEVLNYSGGVLPTSQLQNVVIERIEGHQKRIIRSFNIDPAYSGAEESLKIPLKDGDVVKIYPVYDSIRQVVYLEGHVKYPLEHELKPGMRLGDLLPSYNVLLPRAYLPRAEIIRLMPPDFHPEMIHFNLAKLLGGDRKQNLALQDMDRIIIYAADEKTDPALVRIKGEVRQAGTYSLLPGMTIKDLIFQAGNLTHKAYLEKASLTRVVQVGAETDILKLDFSVQRALDEMPQDNLLLQRNDEIHVREIPNYSEALRRRVTLEGEFLLPGEYSFAEGERLASLIERAGGLTAEAYPFGAKFMRESVKEIQLERLRDYINQLEQDILNSATQGAELASNKAQVETFEQSMIAKQQLLKKLKAAEPTGRMVIDLEEILVLPSSKFNLELKPGDRLVVNKRPDHVNVIGEVYSSTAIFVQEDMKVDYYIQRVGGPTKNADKGQIYIVRADGSVVSKRQSRYSGPTGKDDNNNPWAQGGFKVYEPIAGDTVIIPQKTEKYRWWTITKDIVDVMYKVAVAAGVLVVLY